MSRSAQAGRHIYLTQINYCKRKSGLNKACKDMTKDVGKSMKVTSKALGVVSAAALSLFVAQAGAYEPGEWLIKVGVTSVSPDESSSKVKLNGETLVLDGLTTELEVDSETQLGITATYMITGNWGVELLAATPFTHTASGKGALSGLDIAELDHLPPTLSAVYHFNEIQGFTPYVGAGLNYTIFFEEDLTGSADQALSGLGLTGGDVELDNSVGIALQVGMDYALNDKWFVNASVRWIDIETTAEIRFDNGAKLDVDVDIDPFVYSLFIGRRF